jgi:hypothetical protein
MVYKKFFTGRRWPIDPKTFFYSQEMAKWSSQNFGKYPDPWYKLRFKPPPDKKKKEKVKKVKEILKKEKEEPKVRWDYFSACFPVLRIRDVYPGSESFLSRIQIFSIPVPGSH